MRVKTARGWTLPAGTTNRHQWQKEAINTLDALRHLEGEWIQLSNRGETPLWSPMYGDDQHKNTEAVRLLDEIATRYGNEITKENAAAIVGDVLAAIPKAKDARKIEDVRTTADEDAERDRLRQANQEKNAADAKIKAAQVAECVERLRELYPWADAGEGMSEQARAARNLQTELKQKWPAVNFKRRSESFAGGNAVRIHWDNGPTEGQVKEISGKYADAVHHIAEDYWGHDSSAFGRAVDKVLGRASYVSGSRHESPEIVEAISRALCTAQNVEYDGPDTLKLYGEHDRERLSQHVYRVLRVTEIPRFGTVSGVEDCPDDESADNNMQPYRITWAIPDTAPPAAGNESARIEKHHHTKRGCDMWLVIPAARVEREEYLRLKAAAKAAGGWYSRKWGTTPGGYAFDSEAGAALFHVEQFGGKPPTGPGGGKPAPGTAEKFRGMAEKLGPEIAGKLDENGQRAMNTARQRDQAGHSKNQGYHLQRTRDALNALAELYEAGTVPPVLAGFTSKKGIHEATRAKMERNVNSCYSPSRDTGEPPEGAGPDVLALWALLTPPDPEQRAADALKQKIGDLKGLQIPGYFPTPPELVAKMIEAAQVSATDTILEPSAGSGAILDGLVEEFGPLSEDPAPLVTVCEISPTLCEILQGKGFDARATDFLELNGSFQYDRVLMNPPFEKLADIDHVLHAFDKLKPGGRLVAIMSPGPFFRDVKKATEFREWLDTTECYEVTEIPSGTFSPSGTGVASNLVVIDKADEPSGPGFELAREQDGITADDATGQANLF